MSALTSAALVKRLNQESVPYELSLPVKAATVIYGGATVCTDSTGYAKGATAATGLKCWGVAEETVDNSAGSNGTRWIKVRCGAFNRDVGGSSDSLAVTDIGALVYAIDDHTVGKTDGTGTRSPAGVFLGYETDGVPFFLLNYQVMAVTSSELSLAATVTTLSSTVTDLSATVTALIATVAALDVRVAALEGP